MASLQDETSIRLRGAVLSAQRFLLVLGRWFKAFPKFFQVVILICLLGFIPAYFLTRTISQKIATAKYASLAITAHNAFANPQTIQTGTVKILANGDRTYNAYAQISNPNLTLAASEARYDASFTNAAGETVGTVNGKIYLLPNQSKYLIFPRIASAEAPISGILKISQVQWQKRLHLPEVRLDPGIATLHEEVNPLTLVAQGVVFNDSAYKLGTVHLTFLLYDAPGQIINVSSRDEFAVLAHQRRAYRQTWPNLDLRSVSRIEVLAETNTLDSTNIR